MAGQTSSFELELGCSVLSGASETASASSPAARLLAERAPAASEVELRTTSSSGGSPGCLPDFAERAVAEFYEAQRGKAQVERERFARLGLTSRSPAKRNRQELYLSDARRRRAADASRRHLLQHPEWWQGPSPLSERRLREHVAAQHFFQVDCEDVALAPEERRSDDAFGEEGDFRDVSEQLLLDGPRSTYVIDGAQWDYAAEQLQLSGFENEREPPLLERDPLEAERRKGAFTYRLVYAVRECLGLDPVVGGSGGGAAAAAPPAPALLLRAISTALSQSGMASLERACESTQVAVSGGEQHLRYELRRVLPGDSFAAGGPASPAWELCMEVRKVQFRSAIFYRDEASEPMMMEFGEGSSFGKRCRLRFRAEAGPPGRVEVDTLELTEEVELFDAAGARLPWPLPQMEGPRPPALSSAGRSIRSTVGHRCCTTVVTCCQHTGTVCTRWRLRWRSYFAKDRAR